MKLTNGDIYNARESLMALLEEKMPVGTSLKLAKLANKLNVELKAIEVVRNGLIKMYGTSGENGQIEIKVDSPDFGKFSKEFEELMAHEVEVEVDKIKLPENLSIEPKVLMSIERFIEV